MRTQAEEAFCGLQLEDFVGDVQYTEISAKIAAGVDSLLEKILVQVTGLTILLLLLLSLILLLFRDTWTSLREKGETGEKLLGGQDSGQLAGIEDLEGLEGEVSGGLQDLLLVHSTRSGPEPEFLAHHICALAALESC